MAAGQHDKDRRPRWLDRRRLYTGGALMVLAPVGLAGCDKASEKLDAIAIVPADVLLDVTKDDGGPIAIAPPFDAWDATKDVMAIAPADLGPQDPGIDDGGPIAIAPLDLGPQDPGIDDGGPIAIAPLDLGPQDPGIDDGGPIAIAPPRGTQGLVEPCGSIADCFQQYACETVMCIAPAPGCNEPLCRPVPCQEPKDCSDGAECVAIAPDRGLCVRYPDFFPGDVGASCNPTTPNCFGDAFCVDACAVGGVPCIVPEWKCLPVPCDPANPSCPEGGTCQAALPETGWGLCVRK